MARKRIAGAFSPVLTIDRSASKPLHRQIFDGYRTAILQSEVRAGQQVPSTRSLALELGISRIPVLEAYSQLLAEGYFEARTGAGTFISESLPDHHARAEQQGATGDGDNRKLRSVSRRSSLVPSRTAAPWTYGSGAFSVGQLAFDHFPMRVWSNLVSRRARRLRASSLNYGATMGSKEFRETIANYLRTARAVHCEPDQILVVSGSQQALDLSARALFDPGSRVWVEEPSYILMRYALILAGCDLVAVPVDQNGIDVSAGIRACARAKAAYVTPSHQFPLGVTMSVSRRLQLLHWAKRAGSWIIEDDYDSEYRYESKPIASLQGLDRSSRVIYIGTFSKTLFPALRLGYIVIPSDLVDRFAAVRRALDIFPPYLSQDVLADFINLGHYARHIRRTRQLYAERRDVLVQNIQAEFGDQLEVLGAQAGMHLTVTLPRGVRDNEISERAAESKLWLWPLSSAYARKATLQGFILGFGGVTVDEIPQAVRRLRCVLTAAGCR